jgi:site-specific recombinase XerD
MRLDDAITELRYSKDWTPQTVQWYDRRLGAFIAWAKEQSVAELEAVTPALVRRYLYYLQTRPSKRGPKLDSFTVHGHVRAVRTLLFWAASEDLIDEKVPRRIKPPKKEQKVLQVLSDKQLQLLFRAALQTDAPLRDTALLYLLLDTGCRASELCGLRMQDVTFAPDTAWVLVHGKGRKQREVALGKKARLALSRYIHRERKSEQERVFIGRKGALAPEGLDRLLYRLRDAAGREHFTGLSVAAHRWRHTHAVKALEAGMDTYALSKQMGHSEIGTTTGYLKAVSARQIRSMSISPLDVMRGNGRSS